MVDLMEHVIVASGFGALDGGLDGALAGRLDGAILHFMVHLVEL